MLNISPAYFHKTTPVNFKCHRGYTDVHVDGKDISVNNYTTFFRDYETLDFTKNYLLKNFPNGTKIAEFGASTGQKPYSLMIALDKNNKDRKYKMTAFDFPEVLEQIKETPLYGLNAYTKEEQLLFDDYKKSVLFGPRYVEDERANELKETFFNYFDNYEPKQIITVQKYKILKKLIEENPYSNDDSIKQAKLDIAYADLIPSCTKTVKPNKKAKELVTFKNGDINNIDKLLIPNENGAVIFQNALYHILSGHDLDYEIEDLLKNVHKTRQLFKKINHVLPQNGIFVLGTLASDHIYCSDYEDKTRLAYQDGKQIRVYDSSPVHQSLRECGFEPVFYDATPETTAYSLYRRIKVPSVWKKVREA